VSLVPHTTSKHVGRHRCPDVIADGCLGRWCWVSGDSPEHFYDAWKYAFWAVGAIVGLCVLSEMLRLTAEVVNPAPSRASRRRRSTVGWGRKQSTRTRSRWGLPR
jgi:hypothetical protein